jgi:hypothetical protein
VIGVMADGTLIVGDKAINTASVVPKGEQSSPPRGRRFGEKINGGSSAP